MKTLKSLPAILIFGFSFGLAFVSTPAFALFSDESVNVKLKTPENGSLESVVKQTKTPLKAETPTEVRLDGPTFVNLNGRIPVLLIPVTSGQNEIKLNPPMIADYVAAPQQRQVSTDISEIMLVISSIQKDIQKRNVEAASSKLEDLQKRYPNVAYLEFVRGSILLLQGQKAKARDAVLRGLEAHPNYKDGQDFLKALGGDSPPEKAGTKKPGTRKGQDSGDE